MITLFANSDLGNLQVARLILTSRAYRVHVWPLIAKTLTTEIVISARSMESKTGVRRHGIGRYEMYRLIYIRLRY